MFARDRVLQIPDIVILVSRYHALQLGIVSIIAYAFKDASFTRQVLEHAINATLVSRSQATELIKPMKWKDGQWQRERQSGPSKRRLHTHVRA